MLTINILSKCLFSSVIEIEFLSVYMRILERDLVGQGLRIAHRVIVLQVAVEQNFLSVSQKTEEADLNTSNAANKVFKSHTNGARTV